MELTVDVEFSGKESSLDWLDTIGVVLVTAAAGSLVSSSKVVLY